MAKNPLTDLKTKYKEISLKFSKQSRREQIMIIVAIVVVAVFPLYMNLVDPAINKIKKVKAEQNTIIEETSNTQLELNNILVQLQEDPAEALRKEKEEIQTKIKNLDEDLTSQTVDLIPAYEMPGMLKDVLANTSGLTLLSMKNETPKVLIEQENGVSLYRHGTTIVLQGSYLSVLSYLQLLENLNKKFIWGTLNYEVKEYPKGVVQIHVYTLSSNKDFIRG